MKNKHPNAKFINSKHKDKYWNRINPRGIYSHLAGMVDNYFEREDDDPSWDAHKH